jgi:hypothetical protein
MNTPSLTHAEQAVQANARACGTAGHAWQPTIILGYCQVHQQLRTPETAQEVLG